MRGNTKEYPYSLVRLGRPKGRISEWQFSTRFKILVEEEDKKYSFDVTDGWLKDGSGRLYSFVKSKTPEFV